MYILSYNNSFAYIKNQFSKVVKIIGSSNGTEFTNTICQNLFKQLAVFHQRTCAYTPQQNGVDESKHRQCLDITREIGMQAHVPIRF